MLNAFTELLEQDFSFLSFLLDRDLDNRRILFFVCRGQSGPSSSSLAAAGTKITTVIEGLSGISGNCGEDQPGLR